MTPPLFILPLISTRGELDRMGAAGCSETIVGSDDSATGGAGSLRSVFSKTLSHLLPEFFDAPAVVEPRATCANCAMCSPADTPLAATGFRPDIKCCTYWPTLPNFLVGSVLSDTSSELEPARRVMRERISSRIGVTPYWLAPPRKYLVLLDAARESSFGRSDALLCPYYLRESGQCGIWKHREAVCATFFCKHAQGAVGHAFWRAVKRLVIDTETRLAEHLARAVAPDTREPVRLKGRLSREELEDRPPDDASYVAAWGKWVGREIDFYVECARRASAMSPSEGEALRGPQTGALLEEIKSLHAQVTQPRLAVRLALSGDMAVEPGEGGVGVTTYSRYDSFFLSDGLYEALKMFTHEETVEAVLDRLRRDHGIELPESLLLQMQLQGVVVPPKNGD
jgi:hypothetical protein